MFMTMMMMMMMMNFFSQIVPFMRYVEKYSTTGQATDDKIILRMRNTL